MKREIKINKEDAEEILSSMINCFDVIDMEAEIEGKTEADLDQEIVKNPLLWGIMYGYLSYDEANSSITQKLMEPLKSGEKSIGELTYQTRINATHAGKMQSEAKNIQINFTNSVVGRLTKTNKPVIEKMSISDMKIASAISSLFLL